MTLLNAFLFLMPVIEMRSEKLNQSAFRVAFYVYIHIYIYTYIYMHVCIYFMCIYIDGLNYRVFLGSALARYRLRYLESASLYKLGQLRLKLCI